MAKNAEKQKSCTIFWCKNISVYIYCTNSSRDVDNSEITMSLNFFEFEEIFSVSITPLWLNVRGM